MGGALANRTTVAPAAFALGGGSFADGGGDFTAGLKVKFAQDEEFFQFGEAG